MLIVFIITWEDADLGGGAGTSALARACYCTKAGAAEAVRALLAAGADPNTADHAVRPPPPTVNVAKRGDPGTPCGKLPVGWPVY
eukprot:450161-Prorocentrum_minimum.AAC.2